LESTQYLAERVDLQLFVCAKAAAVSSLSCVDCKANTIIYKSFWLLSEISYSHGGEYEDGRLLGVAPCVLVETEKCQMCLFTVVFEISEM
jgi:hypothetical protein